MYDEGNENEYNIKKGECNMNKNPMSMIFIITLLLFFTLGCLNVYAHNDQMPGNDSTIQSLIAEQTGYFVSLQ